jgi:hypothetical protein
MGPRLPLLMNYSRDTGFLSVTRVIEIAQPLLGSRIPVPRDSWRSSVVGSQNFTGDRQFFIFPLESMFDDQV